MSIVPPLPSPIDTRYTLVFGTHFHPFGGSIYPIDGGKIFASCTGPEILHAVAGSTCRVAYSLKYCSVSDKVLK